LYRVGDLPAGARDPGQSVGLSQMSDLHHEGNQQHNRPYPQRYRERNMTVGEGEIGRRVQHCGSGDHHQDRPQQRHCK